MGAAVALQQPWQQGQQQSEGQKVQQEAEEHHGDHARLLRRLRADGWARGAAPSGSPAHDPAWLRGWQVCMRPPLGTPALHGGRLSPPAPARRPASQQPPRTLKTAPDRPAHGRPPPIPAGGKLRVRSCAEKPQPRMPTVARGRMRASRPWAPSDPTQPPPSSSGAGGETEARKEGGPGPPPARTPDLARTRDPTPPRLVSRAGQRGAHWTREQPRPALAVAARSGRTDEHGDTDRWTNAE